MRGGAEAGVLCIFLAAFLYFPGLEAVCIFRYFRAAFSIFRHVVKSALPNSKTPRRRQRSKMFKQQRSRSRRRALSSAADAASARPHRRARCEYVLCVQNVISKWSRFARVTRFARLIKKSKMKSDVSVALRTF